MAEYRCKIAHKQVVGKGKFITRKIGDGPVEFDKNPGPFWKLIEKNEPPKTVKKKKTPIQAKEA